MRGTSFPFQPFSPKDPFLHFTGGGVSSPSERSDAGDPDSCGEELVRAPITVPDTIVARIKYS